MIKIQRLIKCNGASALVSYDPNDRRPNRDIDISIRTSIYENDEPSFAADISLNIEAAELLVKSLKAAINKEARE